MGADGAGPECASRVIAMRTLGRLEVAVDGVHALLPYTKAALLLLLLALESDGSAGRDRLARLLWSTLPDAAARRNLRHAISAVNRVMRALAGRDVIVRRGAQRIALAVGVDLDSRPFLRDDEVAPDADAAERGLAAYRGEFLAAVPVTRGSLLERWVEQLRRRARTQARALFAAATAGQGGADDARLARLARRHLAADPAHEAAHRLLIETLVRDGCYEDAAAQYHECVQALDAELGRRPAPATRALYEAAKAQGDAQREPAASAAHGPAERTCGIPCLPADASGRAGHHWQFCCMRVRT